MGHRRLARARSLVDRHQAGEPHQTLDPFAVDDMALGRQPRRHPPRAVIRPRQVLPINQRHNRAVFLADLRRPAVDRSAGDRQQPALSRYRQHCSLALDQTAPFRPAHLPSFRDKKSFSTFSWPICRYRTSTCAALAVSSATAPPPSKTFVAPSSSCFFHRRSGSGEPVRARQLGDGPVALDRRQRHLGLERRPVLLACLLHVPAPAPSALPRGRAPP